MATDHSRSMHGGGSQMSRLCENIREYAEAQVVTVASGAQTSRMASFALAEYALGVQEAAGILLDDSAYQCVDKFWSDLVLKIDPHWKEHTRYRLKGMPSDIFAFPCLDESPSSPEVMTPVSALLRQFEVLRLEGVTLSAQEESNAGEMKSRTLTAVAKLNGLGDETLQSALWVSVIGKIKTLGQWPTSKNLPSEIVNLIDEAKRLHQYIYRVTSQKED